MPDYKKMYFDLFRATAQASELLIAAQQAAEQTFAQSQEAQVFALPIKKQPSPKDE